MGMGWTRASGPIRLVPLIVKLQIGRQRSQDPRFEDHRFASHIVAFPMNLQEMMPLVDIEVPPLRPSQFDTAQAHGTPEDGHGIVSERQLLCGPRGSTSGHDP